jgi:hypothetical protein
MVDSLTLPAWVVRMLRRIADSSYATLALVVANDAGGGTRQNLWRALLERRSALLYIAYSRLENRFLRPEPDPMAPMDAAHLFDGLPILRVTPIQKGFTDRFRPEDVERIRAHQIDVFLRLGFRILRGDALRTARYGVWSYHHGDNRVNRGGPAGFWEVMEEHPLTGSILQILTEDLDGGRVLYRSWSATVLTSVNHNRANYYWKSLSFVPRMLEQLHRVGGETFLSRVEEENRAPDLYSHPLYSTPGNGRMARLLLRRAWTFLKRKIYWKLFFEQWLLLYDSRPAVSGSPRRFHSLVPAKDRFWADPHVVEREGRHWVFLEEFPYRADRGHISVLEFDEKGRPVDAAPREVLSRPYHLSHPFLFEYRGELFMIPETLANRTVELYRCAEFPGRWELHATLMQDVDAVDATLFEHDGKWWMFVGLCENPGASSHDELFLFYASDPLGASWTPHPRNPIVSDVRRARPAGGLFRSNGAIFRPAQDCSRSYGCGIRLHEVRHLSETDYEEREVGALEPLWRPGLVGTHSISHAGRLTVIDARQRRLRFGR